MRERASEREEKNAHTHTHTQMEWNGKIARIKIDDVDNSIGNVIQAP